MEKYFSKIWIFRIDKIIGLFLFEPLITLILLINYDFQIISENHSNQCNQRF